MSKEEKKKRGYQQLNRFFDALGILGLIVIVVGGITHGVDPTAILTRGILVILFVTICARIIIRAWAAWEEVNKDTPTRGA